MKDEKRNLAASVAARLLRRSNYWENPSRPAQIRAFAHRAGITVSEQPGGELLAVVRPFLLPVLDDLRSGAARSGAWSAGGPWL